MAPYPAATAGPVERADAASPWAILEIAPDSLPVPAGGYVDLFEDDAPEASGDGEAAAPPAPTRPAGSELEPPPECAGEVSALADVRPAHVRVPPPRLAGPETVLLTVFLAVGGVVGAVAHGRAAEGAGSAARAGSFARAPAPAEAREILLASAAGPERPTLPARRLSARPSGAPEVVARRATRTPRDDGALARVDPLPPAPAPEPGPVHDPAAAPDAVPTPALSSTTLRVAADAEGRAAGRRARLADPGCVRAALRLPAGAAAVESAKVRVAVEPDGTPASVELLSGATDPAVAGAIRGAVSACRFVPATDGAGSAVRAGHVLAIDFVAR